MPDLSDVVRHVIIRLRVASEGVQEELAAARASLKKFQEEQKGANQARARDVGQVTKATDEHTKALRRNADAQSAVNRSTTGTAKALEAHRANTEAVKEETKAVNERSVAEAKADKIRSAAADAAEKSAAQIRAQQERTTRGEDRKDFATTSGESRRDATTGRADDRADETAANKRRIESLKADADIQRAREASEQKLSALNSAAEEKRHHESVVNEDKEYTQKALNVERLAQERVKTQSTIDSGRVQRDVGDSQRNIAGSRENIAGSQEILAATKAQSAEDKLRADTASRINRERREEENHAVNLEKHASQLGSLEERRLKLIDERGRREARAAAARPTGLSGALSDVGQLGSAFSTGFRSPRPGLHREEDSDDAGAVTRLRRSVRDVGDAFKDASNGEKGAAAFFRGIKNGAAGAIADLTRLGRGAKAAGSELGELPRAGGSGGVVAFLKNFSTRLEEFGGNLLDKLNIEKIGKFFFSMRGLIVVLIGSLGPLAAILGSVGAAALGLASNLGALAGSVAALPGLIGALGAGMGALLIVMKPISGIFSDFAAKQKEATTATAAGVNTAKTAAIGYQQALLSQQQAQLTYNRALEDEPKALQTLAKARLDAKRQIEDYRLALQKLKFDEEGSALGVASAEQEFRRALADPTKNSLDRQQARHDVQGALFDQRDQKVAGQRLQEDSSLAFKQGVEGTNAVTQAERGLQDASIDVRQAQLGLQKALLETAKAAKDTGAPAAQRFAAEIAKLPPKTREVVLSILDLSKSYKSMRDRLSEKVFGPLADDTGRFKDVLKILETFLTPAATALGKLADQAIRLFTNADWKRFFAAQGKESGIIIERLGNAALHFADGLRGITEAARPFTRFVVSGVEAAAAAFDKFSTSESGREKISTFLTLTQKRIGELWPIIKNFAAGIAGFFTALNTPLSGESLDFTSKLNDGLLGISKTFRDFGEAAAKPNSGFQKWLKDVGPLLHDVGKFIGQVGSAFGRLLSDPKNIDEARNILKDIGEKWLPAIVDIFSKLSESGFLDKIAKAIGSAFIGIQAFVDAGGVTTLSVIASVLEAIGTAIEFLTTKVPGLTKVLVGLSVALATIAGLAVLARLVSRLTGIISLVKTVKTSVGEVGVVKTATSAATGGLQGTGGVIPHLGRIEVLLTEILTAIRAGGIGGGGSTIVDGPDGGGGGGGGKGKAGKGVGRAVVNDVEEVAEGAAKRGGLRGVLSKLIPGLGATAVTAGTVAATDPGLLASMKKFFTWSGGSGSTAAHAGEDVAETAVKGGALSRAGGLVARGIKATNPLLLAGSIAAQAGTDYAIDKFVKKPEDRGSLRRASGAVINAASLGSYLGPEGTAAGAAIGAAYSAVKDPNLRHFIAASAKPGIDSAKQSPVTAALDTVLPGAGTLASKTDIGKSILDSLNKIAPKVGKFFTETIPTFFSTATSKIGKFFSETIPGFVGGLVSSIGKFFSVTVPGYVDGLVSSIGKFFSKTLPDFFTNNVIKPIGDFFTKTLPNAPATFFANMLNTFHEIGRGIGYVLDFFAHVIPRAATIAWHAVEAGATFLWKAVVAGARIAWDGVVTAGKHAWTAVESAGKAAWKAVVAGAKAAWKAVVDGAKRVGEFFTEDLPRYAGQAWAAVLRGARTLSRFFTVTAPQAIHHFFAVTLPAAARAGWRLVIAGAQGIARFFTVTGPRAVRSFFVDTIPEHAKSAWKGLKTHLLDPLGKFFSETIPNFFTKTIPDAIAKLPGFIKDNVLTPIANFFSNGAEALGAFFSGGWGKVKQLFSSALSGISETKNTNKMSGGVIEGVYQGIEDNVRLHATSGEFVVRRGKTQQPQGQRFLTDFNEGRFNPADWYAGLSAQAMPQVQVMSVVPPSAAALTNRVVTSSVSTTTNAGLSMGDITINNPVREKAEHSLRRSIQVAAVRHRR